MALNIDRKGILITSGITLVTVGCDFSQPVKVVDDLSKPPTPNPSGQSTKTRCRGNEIWHVIRIEVDAAHARRSSRSTDTQDLEVFNDLTCAHNGPIVDEARRGMNVTVCNESISAGALIDKIKAMSFPVPAGIKDARALYEKQVCPPPPPVQPPRNPRFRIPVLGIDIY